MSETESLRLWWSTLTFVGTLAPGAGAVSLSLVGSLICNVSLSLLLADVCCLLLAVLDMFANLCASLWRPPFRAIQSLKRSKRRSPRSGTYCTGDVHSFVHILFWYLLFSTFHVCILCMCIYGCSLSCHGTYPTKFLLYVRYVLVPTGVIGGSWDLESIHILLIPKVCTLSIEVNCDV